VTFDLFQIAQQNSIHSGIEKQIVTSEISLPPTVKRIVIDTDAAAGLQGESLAREHQTVSDH
jgi:hypothetical protein